MQIAQSFDRTSLKKIGKGALIGIGSVLIAFLAANVNEINKAIHASPLLAGLITAAAGVVINVVKEWITGAKRQTLEGHEAEVDTKVLELVEDVKAQAKEDVSKTLGERKKTL